MKFLFISALADGKTQGYKLECSSTATTATCNNHTTLTNDAPLNGDIIDFLVKGPYMFVTQHNRVCRLFVVVLQVYMQNFHGYIFDILQHIATKLRCLSHSQMLFLAENFLLAVILSVAKGGGGYST